MYFDSSDSIKSEIHEVNHKWDTSFHCYNLSKCGFKFLLQSSILSI